MALYHHQAVIRARFLVCPSKEFGNAVDEVQYPSGVAVGKGSYGSDRVLAFAINKLSTASVAVMFENAAI